MSWEAITAIAEAIRDAAVVVSIIYVGIQIRQSNALTRADTIHQK